MMLPFFAKSKICKSLITSVLVISFVIAPLSYSLQTQKAEAQWAVVDAPNLGANSVTAGATFELSTFFTLKEFPGGFDTIVWMLINTIIQQMIRSVTAWVNSGFQGSPAFIQDLGGFLTGIADRVAGDYIFGSDLAFLCSPFKLDLQFALGIQYRKSRSPYKSQCSLSGVVKNIDSFMQGNFLEGGWDGWYSVALTPSNNPYQAMLDAQSSLTISLSGAQGKQLKLLDFGKGFLSKTDSKGKIVTPGAVIETQLNDALGSPTRRLEVADEVNELIGALFAQLAGQVLGGIGGLLGLTGSGSSGGGGENYFDRMMDEQIASAGAGASTAIDSVKTAIADEQKYSEKLETLIDILIDASVYKENTYPDTDIDGDGTIDPNRCHDGVLPESLSTQLNTFTDTLISSDVVLMTLEVINEDYTLLTDPNTPEETRTFILQKYNADSVPAALLVLMQQYSDLRSGGKLHAAVEYMRLDLETAKKVQEDVDAFIDSVDNACDSSDNS